MSRQDSYRRLPPIARARLEIDDAATVSLVFWHAQCSVAWHGEATGATAPPGSLARSSATGPISRGWLRLFFAFAGLAGQPGIVVAQGIEVSPFGGYRFGGGFYEIETMQPVDVDGAPAMGLVVDVPLWNGLSVEGLFTHQRAAVWVPAGPEPRPTVWHITVDHWQGGAIQAYDYGRIRPFLTGIFGLTHFAAEDDHEIRFTLGAGGGVKLYPVQHVGVRLDTRVFATFVDAGGRALACAPGTCLVALHLNVVWQAEFTAGVIVRFP